MPDSSFDFITGRRFDGRRDLPALILALLTIILGFTGSAGRVALRYEREAILSGGEVWRLFSGHLVHLGWSHLLLNLAGCLLVWVLFRNDYRLWQWLVILALSVIVIDAGFLWLNPELAWYVGLSGLLHGLFAAGLVAWLREQRWESWLVLSAFLAKIGWEQYAGALPLSAETAGGPVVVDAHLYGAAGGFVAAAIIQTMAAIRDRYNAQPLRNGAGGSSADE